MKHLTSSLSLAALCLALSGCGKEDTTVQARFKDFSKEKEIKGVIGPALSADDRKVLIEYLKTL